MEPKEEPVRKMKDKQDNYLTIYPSSMLRVDKDGTILYSNEAGKVLLREWKVVVGETLPPCIVDLVQQAISRNNPEKIEVDVGKRAYLTVFYPLCEEKGVCIFGFDISGQKKFEEKTNVKKLECEIELEFLKLVNESKSTVELVHSALNFFSNSYDIEAVGVRLQLKYDYPFFETKGFIKEYPKSEDILCAWNDSGQFIYVNSGTQIKKSMCKNVICGQIDPSISFFTSQGSFWTNSTTELLATSIDADNSIRKCNKCNKMGYESLAIIALRVNEETLGLLQLNDRRKGLFSSTTIIKLERLAKYLALSLSKKRVDEFLLEAYETLFIQSEKLEDKSEELQRAYEILSESEEKYRSIVETANEGIQIINTEHKTTYVNQKMAEMLGYSREEIIGRSVRDFTDEEGKAVFENLMNKRRQGINENHEFRFIRKDGASLWVHVNAKSFFDKNGKFSGSISMLTDITKRKEAETKLKETLENLEKLVIERTKDLETANKSLKESESSLVEAQKMAHIGNIDWNLVTGEVYCSNEMYNILKRNPQEPDLTYNEFLNYIHPDYRNKICNSIDKALSGDSDSGVYSIILANGEESKIFSHIKAIFNEKGTPIQLKGTFQDVTKLYKYEEKISNLANIVETSNDAIGTLSPEGIITSWNKSAEKVYGYSVKEILGEPISILAPPHLIDETKNLSEKIKQGERIHHYETIRQKKDGTIINVSITLSPVFNSYGEMIAVSFISRDITDNKAIEEKLRKSEKKYRNIVETANEGIVIIDKEAIITFENNRMEDMLGYAHGEGIGRPIWNFLNDDESKAIVKLNLKNRWLGIDDNYELKLTKKDGTMLWAIVNAKSLLDKDGEYLGTLSMFTDITIRKEAKQALEKFEIAREKEIHHRIKNNFQIVSSLLDIQADKFLGRCDIKDLEILDAFKECQNRVMSMALIHEELYRGSGLETINFSDYIEKLSENLLLTYRLGNKTIKIERDIENDIFLDIDTAIPLGTLINEIVTNSFKHAFIGKENGEIWISLHREIKNFVNISEKENFEDAISSNLILSVSDNGVGIPKNLHIENLDSLGLQLVTSLVDQLKGELEIKRNKGTE
ncbi:MAG: hypothetical protein QG646_4396, partial [Euryarchaeota archaeon]|nr:hypothetical protein [Euryarchaeota archaeon]